jgi:hypothetical protein
MSGMYTCTIRKVTTGYKVSAFCGDSLDDLRAISTTLMQSTSWSLCYIVCTDWQGNQCFVLQPQGQSQLAPGAGYAPVQSAPRPEPRSLGGMSAAPRRPEPWEDYDRSRALAAAREHATRDYPVLPASPSRVVDGEFEPGPVIRALPPRR